MTKVLLVVGGLIAAYLLIERGNAQSPCGPDPAPRWVLPTVNEPMNPPRAVIDIDGRTWAYD